jgi:hypothetical protein
MGQKKRGSPSGGDMLAQKIKKRRKHRIEKNRKRTDHDHDFEGHDKENHDGRAGQNSLGPRFQAIFFHVLILSANYRVYLADGWR